MNYYQFSESDARRFAREQGVHVRKHGDELQFTECPYCHGGANHDKSTFAINLTTGQFNCKRASCNAHGNMITLHRDFGFDLGADFSEYERPAYTWKHFKVDAPIVPTKAAVDYLTGRGIPEDIVCRYEIKTHKDNDGILVFPFFDENAELTFIKYRKIDFKKGVDKNKEWCEPGMKTILFGMAQCVPDKPLILTEGQIDSLSVATAGFYNAVSVPTGARGMTWIPHCWDWLHKFDKIIVFGDYEHDAMTLLPEIKSRFDWMQVSAVRPEDYKGCKDANELLQKFGVDAVKYAVDHAEVLMPDQIMRLSDVPYNDMTEERLPTGIGGVDDLLDGGLPFGNYNIITGVRGEGKSTFGSMIVKSALDHDYSVFIYSGEMRMSDVRRWLDRQIAGHNRCQDEHGNIERLSEWNKKIITEWYRDRAYIYNTENAAEDSRPLTEIIETSIKQFSTRVILIDNLMTAIDLYPHGNDKGEKHELLCKELARMAQKYNVCIILIAHKRKDNGNPDVNDNVLGSSEITNLAGVIMSYERDKDSKTTIAKEDRLLKVTKNRLSGKCEFDGFCVKYDEASKRIYWKPEELNVESPCFRQNDDSNDGFKPIDDENYEEIPF